MKKIFFLYLSLIFSCCQDINAQDLKFQKFQLDLSYYSNEVFRPGGSIQIDYAFLHAERWKNVVHRKDKEITHIRHHALNVNFFLGGFYFDSTKTWGNSSLGLSYKRISGRLWVTEVGANAGYSRSFLAKDTPFEEWENDEKFIFPGAGYLSAHYYLNIGKYFREPILGNFLKGISGGIHYVILYNYNGATLPQINAKLGLIIR